MKELVRPTLTLLAAFTLLTGLVYPLLITAVCQVAFPPQAKGSLIVREGTEVGSELIGQQFTDPRYFWGRPSATVPVPYNAMAGTGTNLGPLNPALKEQVAQRVRRLRQADPDNRLPVPIDLVTASGSGLDPHLSLAAAEYQVMRVARQRNLPVTEVSSLVAQHVEPRQWGFLGEPRVNVLELNLSLDTLGKVARAGH
ncbi:potassium-transporting ATPase subunit KdpC [bacterium]|nr:potassium-transporting ATPase subunit KdpC [bacterium]